jgi:hypothetical protein
MPTSKNDKDRALMTMEDFISFSSLSETAMDE